MTRICMWCNSPWEAPPAANDSVAATTCQACQAELFPPGQKQPLQAYLDQFKLPILVLDQALHVVGLNKVGAALLDKPASACVGPLAGDVMECAYARLAGGCGNTIHCQACTIRRTVTRTQLSGQAQRDVLAYQDIETRAGPRQRLMRISTEKVGPYVLLRIEPLKETDAATH